MAVKAHVVEATADHAAYIAKHMRESDKIEIAAAGHDDPLEAMETSLRLSSSAWTAMIGDEPVLMFGVTPISVLSGLGSPWLLGTDRMMDIKRQFIRECRHYVADMLRLYPRLMNYVDCRNTVSIKWLQWLGFKLADAQPIGVQGEAFYPFSMEI